MNLFETLKQLRNIDANPEFTEKSRRAILASAQNEPVSVHGMVLRIFETAGSLVLAGLLVFAIVGGFSGSKYLSPVSFQGIDPVALHAEADAIDMQINLANMSYMESAASTESTPAAPSGHVPTLSHPASTASIAPASSTQPVSTSTAASSTSINEALQQLTE